ncbi:MAG: type III secretion system export apparatus subunit SctT [Chthoniobacterales bacterium]|nr:type III secretion system export apparatus subunit SctT [Chthoniobacterales bacterium]
MDSGEIKKLITQGPLIMALGSVRLGMVLTIVPFFGISGLPRQVLLVMMMAIVVPMLAPTLSLENVNLVSALVLTFKEAFIGILIAFFVSVIFWAIEVAGELIDLQRGTTAGGIYNPMLGAQESPLGGMFLRIISYIFFGTGGFLLLLGVLFASYEAYPVGSLLPPLAIGWQSKVFPFFTQVFELGILYSAPLLIIFFFMDFGLGLINRFVSQLNVFFISLPIKSGLCFIFLPFYMSYLIEGFQRDLFTGSGAAAFLKGIFHG